MGSTSEDLQDAFAGESQAIIRNERLIKHNYLLVLIIHFPLFLIFSWTVDRPSLKHPRKADFLQGVVMRIRTSSLWCESMGILAFMSINKSNHYNVGVSEEVRQDYPVDLTPDGAIESWLIKKGLDKKIASLVSG